MTTVDYGRLFELDQDALRCPHLYFAALAELGPVVHLPELGFYVLTRHDDILEAVRNPELFSSSMPTGPQMTQAIMAGLMQALEQSETLRQMMAAGKMPGAQPVLLNADPPLHNRQRGLVSRAFGPRRVAAMEARIRDIAEELVDAFVGAGRVELVSQFAVTLPLTVIAEALGVPSAEMPSFKKWSDDFVVAIGNHKLSTERLVEMMDSQAAFADYFAAKIQERRAAPQDDLITDVVNARLDGDEPLSDAEMLGMFAQFLVAGNETTTKLIASGMRLLLEHPDQMERVRADYALIPGFVEEVLRVESPVQGLFRVVNADTEVAGVPLPRGASVLMAYAAGNRDASMFPDPDHFDVSRDNAKMHLAFGQGPHYCIGAALARAEARIAFEVLLARLDNIRLATENTYEYEESYVLHGLKELHLQFEGRET